MNIKGKFVTLRMPEPSDMKMMCDMLNDPEMEKKVVGWSFPISLEQQKRWYEKTIDDKSTFRFVVETPQDGAVGIATLSNIDWKNRRATHGIKLTGNVGGKGIGTDAVMAVMRYAFEELNLNRLDGSWYEDNLASQNLYKKCGWKEEGCRRNYIFKNGQYKNLIITGILAEEYFHLIQENHYWHTEGEGNA